MIVISDTSPLNYLILVNVVEILPALFQQVYIPQCVARELRHPAASIAVRDWINHPPSWLVIREPGRIVDIPRLDPGEIHAISLALELGADRLLIDEWKARSVAKARGLHVIGILGVLDQAAERGLIDLRVILERLQQTTFRVEQKLINQMLEQDASRKSRK